jgi:hypothetical protein
MQDVQRMGTGVGLFPQTRSFRSSGSNRSRSASELLLRKRPSFLAWGQVFYYQFFWLSHIFLGTTFRDVHDGDVVED